MSKKTIGKAYLSISNIGLIRFWIGLYSGFITALVLSLFFAHSRQTLRFFTQSGGSDLLILSDYDHWFYNYFFSAVSVILGLGMTVIIWLGNNYHKRNTDRRNKRYSQTLILLYFWLIIMGLTRIGTILPIVLQGLFGYDNHLDLSNDFKWIFIAIPWFMFVLIWSMTRRIYKSVKWIGLSIPVLLVSSFAIAHLSNVDPEPLNKAHLMFYKEQHKYIDTEIQKAKENYGVNFQEQTISVLKKWYAEGSTKQMWDVRDAFGNEEPLSLDTIILGKIVFHNLKEGRRGNWSRQPWGQKWQYPHPLDIFEQFKKFEIGSNESNELLAILNDQIMLWNIDRLKDHNYNVTSAYEHERIYVAQYQMHKGIVIQLQIARDSLMNIKDFTQHYGALPEITPYTRLKYSHY